MQKLNPWIALFLFAGSLGIYLIPNLSGYLIFDRESILKGEVWRLFTCNLVHFSFSHLFLDFAVLLSAYLLVERSQFFNIDKVLMYAMALMGPALIIFDSRLAYFGGSSALVSAAVFYVLIYGCQNSDPEKRWFYIIALLACLAKTFIELTLEIPSFVLPKMVRPLPLSHLLGYLIAIGIYIAQRHGFDTFSGLAYMTMNYSKQQKYDKTLD